eukprot:6191342-Pleurochrysis_carterae.AAC.4
MARLHRMNALTLVLATSGAHAWSTPSARKIQRSSQISYSQISSRAGSIQAGFFDFFKESEEVKARKDAEFKAQQEYLARRRNPEKMKEYEESVMERRVARFASDYELTQLQQNSDGKDRLEEWRKLKEQGKVKSMDSTARDADSERLGSAGLINERMDAQLPYIDDGYVDASAPDLMGELSKLFQKKDKDQKKQPDA